MIKKPTLIVLLCAIVLAVAVYYFDYRRGQNAKPAEDTTKLAFSLQASDVASIKLSWPAKPALPAIQLEQRNGVWQILQPIETGADQASVQGIANGLSSARITQSEPGTPDRLKAYGLDTPEVSMEFTLKNGSKHSVLLGNKDFTEIYAYGILDGGRSVSLLPESLLVSTDKSLDDLRDHTVLAIQTENITSFDLKNHTGELAASKDKTDWKFTKPAGTLADSDDVSTLLSAVSNAKMTAIVSEKPEDLAKYGLTSPAITFTAADAKGAKSTLLVGKKESSDYYARDTSRPMIFRISEDVYKKLSQNYTDLRDKKLVHFDPNSIDHVEVHNADGTIDLTRNSADEWTIDSPANLKGKSAGIWKIFSPLTEVRADEILDHPPANLAASVSKPVVEVNLTSKDGQKLDVRISKEFGDVVYAKSSASPAIYKLKKQTLNDLNFKVADLAY